RKLEEGIQAVQGNNLQEGARLIRIALKDQNLTPNLRAVGLLWLARTDDDIKFKIECYRRASQIDPNNLQAAQLLTEAMSQQLLAPHPGDSQRIQPLTDSQQLRPLPTDDLSITGSGYTSVAMTPIRPEIGTE